MILEFRLEPELTWSEQMAFCKNDKVDFVNSIEKGQIIRFDEEDYDYILLFLSDLTNGNVKMKTL
jgi:hypothetical protein